MVGMSWCGTQFYECSKAADADTGVRIGTTSTLANELHTDARHSRPHQGESTEAKILALVDSQYVPYPKQSLVKTIYSNISPLAASPTLERTPSRVYCSTTIQWVHVPSPWRHDASAPRRDLSRHRGGPCRGVHRGPRPLHPAPRGNAMWGTESGVQEPAALAGRGGTPPPPHRATNAQQPPRQPLTATMPLRPCPVCQRARWTWGARSGAEDVGGTDGSWAGGLASKATTAATPRGSHYEQTLRVLRFRLRGLRVCGVAPQSPSL
jgi:hypothetical protein